jgi:malate synthase
MTLRLTAPDVVGSDRILTPEAVAFVADLHARFAGRRRELLDARRARQAAYDAGARPGFDPTTASIRAGDWRCAPLPADLLDRRVEITGPVDRKMVINALNSGATHFMADFEDSNAPTWANVVQGQLNLADAIRREIRYEQPGTGKIYSLNPEVATLLVRPRGWHLPERHVEVDGEPASGSLVDFGLYAFHNARELVARGSGPYFYLPKLEHHLEAALWDDVFEVTEVALGLPVGTIKATVLIETLPAAFQMDEILFALRRHSAGLNCGRWDYIFSFIKTLAQHPDKTLPDRAQVTMTAPFMAAYTGLVVRTCHRRGVHAMGGMAAQIPIKGDDAANAAAMERVRADKIREVTNGHDGTWVAHPALVPVAKAVFDAFMPGPNQLDRQPSGPAPTAEDLLRTPASGTRTEAGLRHGIQVGVRYLEAWLGGNGCVPLFHLMEDAATAEICRAQTWQWIRHGATLDDGRPVTVALFERLWAEELASMRQDLASARLDEAAELFRSLSTAPELASFLTIPAYEHLLSKE